MKPTTNKTKLVKVVRPNGDRVYTFDAPAVFLVVKETKFGKLCEYAKMTAENTRNRAE